MDLNCSLPVLHPCKIFEHELVFIEVNLTINLILLKFNISILAIAKYYQIYLKLRFTVVNNSCNSNRYLDSLFSSPCSARRPFPRDSNTCPTLERRTLIAVSAVCSCSIFILVTKLYYCCNIQCRSQYMIS